MGWNITDVKSRAKNNWRSILEANGIGSEYLTGEHCPCPKCGGTDRFRFTNMDGDGSAICNQCVKAGDGLSVLEWWTGNPLNECVKSVAEFLHMPEPDKKKKRKSVEEAFVVRGPINESGMAMFCGFNPGITETGVNRARGILGDNFSQHLLGFPAVDESLEKVTNYVVMSPTGKHCKHFPKGIDGFELVRKKTVTTGMGLLGGDSIEFLKTDQYVEVCWKVEGPTSMLALMSVIPESLWGKHVVVSNLFGACERPGWMADVLAKKAQQVYIVPDLDGVGTKSGQEWANAIARAGGKAKIVRLPYKPEDRKDLRDFVQENGAATVSRLMSLVGSQETQVVVPSVRFDNDDIPSSERQVLEAIEVDVLYEDERDNLHVYCVATRKVCKIGQIDKLGYEKLLQMAGLPVKVYVAPSAEDAENGQFFMSQVKRALALAGSQRRLSESEAILRGSGIWPETNKEGELTGRVICCNKGSLSILDRNGAWIESNSARAGSMLFKLDGANWLDHHQMAALIEKAKDPAWCLEQLSYLESLIDRWPWNRAIDSQLLTGLVGATLCQTAWRWRPQISVRGKSNSGKTHWIEFLFGNSTNQSVGLFGKLAFTSARSSPAGVRQKVKSTALCIAIDEWDSYKGPRRTEMLEMLRTAGPGAEMTMGSASHKAVQFGLRNVCWLAGVEVSMEHEADQNRFLDFEVSMHDSKKREAYREPTQDERSAARDALIAMSIVHCLPAAKMAMRLEKLVETKVDNRIRNSLCVPAAFLATCAGLDNSEAAKIAQAFCEAFEADKEDVESREVQLLQDLFALTIQVGTMRYSVAEVLDGESFCESNPEYARQVATQLGIHVQHIDDRKHLAIHPRLAVRALRDDQLTANGLKQNLLRIPGAFNYRARVSAGHVRLVFIPWNQVQESALGFRSPANDF